MLTDNKLLKALILTVVGLCCIATTLLVVQQMNPPDIGPSKFKAAEIVQSVASGQRGQVVDVSQGGPTNDPYYVYDVRFGEDLAQNMREFELLPESIASQAADVPSKDWFQLRDEWWEGRRWFFEFHLRSQSTDKGKPFFTNWDDVDSGSLFLDGKRCEVNGQINWELTSVGFTKTPLRCDNVDLGRNCTSFQFAEKDIPGSDEKSVGSILYDRCGPKSKKDIGELFE